MLILSVFGLVLFLVVVLLLLPLLRIGRVVGERLLDLVRDWGRGGQMVTGRPETVLIGYVVHADLVAVLVGVRVEALGDHRLVLLARILHVSLGRLPNPVARLVLELVVAVLVHLLF